MFCTQQSRAHSKEKNCQGTRIYKSWKAQRLMGRKRRRSEAGESECDDSPAVPAQKKRHHDKWSVPEELYRKVSGR